MIGIANLQMGNLRSVSNAVDTFGYDHRLVDTPEALEDLTHLIMPGVGSFHTAMRRLQETGLAEGVRTYVATGRPLLGVCLGMQLLGSHGEEGEAMAGLDLVPGRVTRFDPELVAAIPHVGWNSVEMRHDHPILKDVRTGVDFYFVHSYHFRPDRSDDVLGVSDYGEQFVSIVAHKNVVGFQFHPEKSQANGLRLLDNFCGWDGRC